MATGGAGLSREAPVQITDSSRRVYRVVVVPGWIHDDGKVDRDAFKPRPQDNGQLSASDKGCDAAEALSKWNESFPKTTRQKVVSVLVEDCAAVGIPVFDDSEPGDLHVHLDFTKCADVDAHAAALAKRCRVEP